MVETGFSYMVEACLFYIIEMAENLDVTLDNPVDGS